jgi:lipid-A-disaccharide synthase
MPPGAAPRIAMVAGEASGDVLATHLIAAIRTRLPGATFCGIGGPRMAEAGFEAWWPADKLAVHGYVEAFKHLRELLGIRAALATRLLADPPDLFIGVDAPDFNFALETRLRERGVRTAHFVSPSIWAWRGGRIAKIKRAVDHMLCLFPFEEALYREAGVPATYVGHPLADVIPPHADQAGARARLGLPAGAPVVALLPGSRRSELAHLGERFVVTAQRLRRENPALRFVVPLASPQTNALWQAAVERCGAQDLGFAMAPQDSHGALAASDIALVASGTATLEAALFHRPLVIAYYMSPLSWAVMRHMSYLPYGGLPNILCRQFVAPEFIQDDATPENMAQALANLLADAPARARIAARFAALHAQLRMGMSERAAAAVMAAFFAS